MSDEPCPCGSRKPYARCCAPLHRGERGAETTEELLRARYSAFVRRDEDYLLSTWLPSMQPESLGLDEALQWLGLTIEEWQGGAGDHEGRALYVVEFQSRGRRRRIRCESLYVRVEGAWLYREDRSNRELGSERVGRNDPCPCGSGRKFKRCCAQ